MYYTKFEFLDLLSCSGICCCPSVCSQKAQKPSSELTPNFVQRLLFTIYQRNFPSFSFFFLFAFNSIFFFFFAFSFTWDNIGMKFHKHSYGSN